MNMRPLTQRLDQTQPIRPQEPPAPAASDVAQYARIILNRLWLIILLVLVTEVTVAGISLLRPVQYSTSIRFRISSLPPSDVTLYQTRSTSSSDPMAATRADFLTVLTSLDVAWDAVESLGLPMSGRALARMITVEEDAESDFIILHSRADSAQLAADVANAVMVAAVRRFGELNAQPLTNTQLFIADQLEQTQEELQEARAELITFEVSHGVAGLDNTIDSHMTLIRALQVNRDEALAGGFTTRADAYQALITERQAELANLMGLSNEYDTLQSRVDQLHSTYDLLLGKLTEAQLKENEARNLNAVQVFGQARIPDAPDPRLNVPLLILSGAVALIVSLVVAFLWEYLSTGQSPFLAGQRSSV